MAMQFEHVLAGIRSGSFKKNGDAVIEGVAAPAMKTCWGGFAWFELAAR